ncbi:MAG: response regulator [Planctomycetes bacterium]|nr:response regulator [Planctomycetota bacterium]
MNRRAPKILLVEPEPDLVELFVAAFAQRFDAQITCVCGVEAALDVTLVTPHDVVIAELRLEDGNGLQLTERLASLSGAPVVLTARDLEAADAVEALRLGVRDLLIKPFPIVHLLDAVDRALRAGQTERARLARYRRMRELVRHVIRDRRDLNRRVELICRDLVGAHQRLVHRVLAIQDGRKEVTPAPPVPTA